MTINERAQEIVEDFSFFEDWMEKYQYLIDLGKELSPMDVVHQKEENLIKGCQSQVWLHCAKTDAGTIHFQANSDAIITKGIISLLLQVVQDRSAKEILDFEFGFIQEIGLQEHLSPTRANGLLSMIKQIKFYALALQNS